MPLSPDGSHTTSMKCSLSQLAKGLDILHFGISVYAALTVLCLLSKFASPDSFLEKQELALTFFCSLIQRLAVTGISALSSHLLFDNACLSPKSYSLIGTIMDVHLLEVLGGLKIT